MEWVNWRLLWGGGFTLILLVSFHFLAGQTAVEKVEMKEFQRFHFGMYPKNIPIPPSAPSNRNSDHSPSPPPPPLPSARLFRWSATLPNCLLWRSSTPIVGFASESIEGFQSILFPYFAFQVFDFFLLVLPFEVGDMHALMFVQLR